MSGSFAAYRPGSSYPYRVQDPRYETTKCPNLRLKVGETIEIPRGSGSSPAEHDIDEDDWNILLADANKEEIDFFTITSVVQNNQNNSTMLRGYRSRRVDSMGGLFLPHVNELCLITSQSADDDRHYFNQWMEEIDLSLILEDGKPVKRNLIFTNAEFPSWSFRDEGSNDFYPFDENKGDMTARLVVQKSQVLVCRWIVIDHCRSRTDQRRSTNRVCRRLTAEEADPPFRSSDLALAITYLGSHPATQSLTFCDGFCGCGGVSVGARAAGLQVILGFDLNQEAIRTWEKHNMDADCYDLDFQSFLQDHASDYQVSVLHLSFPCQAFSLANCLSGRRDPNSTQGRRDESNSAITLSLEEFLVKMRPRVVTIEQTFGLECSAAHRPFLHAMMHALTSQQYSASYKVVNMAEFGVPHRRMRLIIIGSCVGCALPPHPEATHGPLESGLQPYTTIRDCLERVSIDHDDHQPRSPILNFPAEHGNRMLRNIFTTGGSIERHPSGGRNYTVAESLALMTFPPSFSFPRYQNLTTKKRQVGNSVPPMFAEQLMRQIKTCIEAENEHWMSVEDADTNDDACGGTGGQASLNTAVRQSSVVTDSTVAGPHRQQSPTRRIMPMQNTHGLTGLSSADSSSTRSELSAPTMVEMRRALRSAAPTPFHKRMPSGSADNPFHVDE